MDWAGLQNFFVMHGENIDRKEGRPGRGRFGTGKSAVFGIAATLRIISVRNRKRSIVELSRADIETMTSEEPIPVRKLEKEIATDQPNGTIVEIEGVHLRTLRASAAIITGRGSRLHDAYCSNCAASCRGVKWLTRK
jgi:hypothetical protein